MRVGMEKESERERYWGWGGGGMRKWNGLTDVCEGERKMLFFSVDIQESLTQWEVSHNVLQRLVQLYLVSQTKKKGERVKAKIGLKRTYRWLTSNFTPQFPYISSFSFLSLTFFLSHSLSLSLSGFLRSFTFSPPSQFATFLSSLTQTEHFTDEDPDTDLRRNYSTKSRKCLCKKTTKKTSWDEKKVVWDSLLWNVWVVKKLGDAVGRVRTRKERKHFREKEKHEERRLFSFLGMSDRSDWIVQRKERKKSQRKLNLPFLRSGLSPPNYVMNKEGQRERERDKERERERGKRRWWEKTHASSFSLFTFFHSFSSSHCFFHLFSRVEKNSLRLGMKQLKEETRRGRKGRIGWEREERFFPSFSFLVLFFHLRVCKVWWMFQQLLSFGERENRCSPNLFFSSIFSFLSHFPSLHFLPSIDLIWLKENFSKLTLLFLPHHLLSHTFSLPFLHKNSS